MRSIIVPTDFSANALYAASYAADFANMIGARLDLLHIYSLPLPVSEIPVPYPIDQVEADAQTQMTKLKDKLSTRTAGSVNIHTVVISGDVVTEIGKYCEIVKPFAIVMGAESAGTFERLVFGGKTLTAVRKLPWPLIIVPPYTLFKNIRKIGLACDFREVVETVRVQEIRDIVKEFNAELHILYISDKESDSFSARTVEESGLLQEMLGDLEPRYQFLKQPEIDRGIREYAQSNKLDLLIIIPKKHGLVGKIFGHSHSKELVLHAPVPIMSLHE